jgi:hypothetical protein
MPYRVRWALLGQAERRLDGGSLDGVHLTYGEAAAEVSSFLRGRVLGLHRWPIFLADAGCQGDGLWDFSASAAGASGRSRTG